MATLIIYACITWYIIIFEGLLKNISPRKNILQGETLFSKAKTSVSKLAQTG